MRKTGLSVSIEDLLLPVEDSVEADVRSQIRSGELFELARRDMGSITDELAVNRFVAAYFSALKGTELPANGLYGSVYEAVVAGGHIAQLILTKSGAEPQSGLVFYQPHIVEPTVAETWATTHQATDYLAGLAAWGIANHYNSDYYLLKQHARYAADLALLGAEQHFTEAHAA